MGFVITFVAVVAGMVVFRAPTIATAGNILRGMIGLNGLALPGSVVDRLGRLPTFIGRLNDGVISQDAFRTLTLWIVILGFFALALPNTLNLLSAYEPALGIRSAAERASAPGRRLQAFVAQLTWAPTLAWAVAVSILAIAGIFHLGGNSEFLYWQF